jgi:hypothetical protein
MKTIFYNRTPYMAAQLTVPQCFIDLDDFYDPLIPDMTRSLSGFHLKHAENICRRMGDIELYALFIGEAEAQPDYFWAATIIASYLVGFFSACKSLFDAASICLADLHALELPDRGQDMGKGRFWNSLQARSSKSFTRFKTFRPLCDEIILWRDASVHRTAPLVLVHSPGPPEHAAREAIRIRMVATPGATADTVIGTPDAVDWLAPLDLHNAWRSDLVAFCGALCTEIKESLRSR